MQTIDARGLSCPQPVMMAQKALVQKPSSCAILVDNPAARENVTRFAESVGYKVEITQQQADYTLTLALQK